MNKTKCLTREIEKIMLHRKTNEEFWRSSTTFDNI